MTDKDIATGLKILDDFIGERTGTYLDEREREIISSSLLGFTYQEMQQEVSMLRGVTVEYIARYLAYNLWKKLTLALQEHQIIDRNTRVNKNKLWYVIDEINKTKTSVDMNSSLLLPPQLMEGKILRGRYEITEYLFERHNTERHFRASDRDLGNKPCLIIQL